MKRNHGTPIVDFLIANKESLNANFHTLPIFSMKKGIKGYEKYKNLYGNKYFSSETTITGKVFDSFFFPTRCIKKSQDYAAELFGANDTLFVTCGTSISNQIVVDALITEASHVLLDREAHQSMHFSVNNSHAKFDYFYSETYCESTERKFLNINSLLDKVRAASLNNQPYDVIILSAASYDGVIYNIYKIIKSIVAISPKTKFIVDEAWSSAFYFHDELYKYTAGFAANKLNNTVDIVSTQSAHKSLMALRQASFIHSFANSEITHRLYNSRFKFHSTSPSYPVLASMDLARAHMQRHGKDMLNEAIACAKYFRRILASDRQLSALLHINPKESLEVISHSICYADPLKVHLNIKEFHLQGLELQEYLYEHFGIYFNRYTRESILINIHIGIKMEDINILFKALKSILSLNNHKKISSIADNGFIIPYPPGIPMKAPGELMETEELFLNIQNKINNGIKVIQISNCLSPEINKKSKKKLS